MFEILLIILIFSLLASIALNAFFIWYGRKLLADLYFMSDNMDSLVEEVSIFSNHLQTVHEMEIFYGDETIGGLMRHSSELIKILEDFAEIAVLFQQDEENELEEVTIDDTETSP